MSEKVEAIEMFKAAAKKFIAKVDSGQARSVETYRELKAALQRAEAEEDEAENIR